MKNKSNVEKWSTINTPATTHVARGWNTGDAPAVCTACSYTPETTTQKILMDYRVWDVLMGLCGQIKVEWQALLKGSVDADGAIYIDGY